MSGRSDDERVAGERERHESSARRYLDHRRSGQASAHRREASGGVTVREYRAPPGTWLLAAVVALATYLALSPVLHECLHAIYNAVFAGRISHCGFGPFGVHGTRFYTCLAAGGHPALNVLLTPVTTAAVGVALMWWSPRARYRSIRWGVLVAGTAAWLTQACYSMGFWTPPTLAGHHVSYHGDGITALRAFGWHAALPGFLLLLAGTAVLWKRVHYDTPHPRHVR